MARKTGTRGYQGYRGRNSGRKWLAAFLVLVLLAAGGFLFLQRDVVYEADGTFRFELPWKKNKPDQAPDITESEEKPKQELEIIVEKPARTDLHALELDRSVLQGGWETALEGLDESVNAVAIRVKEGERERSGNILYDSQVEDAIRCGAVTGSSVARASIEGLTGSDYYTIARISALHDSKYAYAHMTDAAVCQLTGYVWYDTYSTHWLAPEKPQARAYVTEIAKECAELGFDELLFDSFAYPRDGRMSRIKTDERTMTQQAALALLADELRDALKEYDIKLSVMIDADIVLAGSEERTGIVMSELAPKFDRVYVAATGETLPQLQEAMEGIDTEFIPMLAEPAEDGSYLIGK